MYVIYENGDRVIVTTETNEAKCLSYLIRHQVYVRDYKRTVIQEAGVIIGSFPHVTDIII